MDDSGSLRIACSTNRSQNCCDTGTDVLTKQNIYCLRKSDYTASCKCLKDTNRSRRGLDDSGKQCTSKDTQYRIGELGHQVDEGLGITQRHHRGAHHIHTDKQNTQTGNDFTVVMNLFLLDKDDERNTDKGEQRGKSTDVQSDQLAGDGGTDVSTHDNPDSLAQCHHTGVYKADNHNGRCGRRLNDHGNDHAHQQSRNDIARHFFECFLQFRACCALQTLSHCRHTVDEQRKTADHLHD